MNLYARTCLTTFGVALTGVWVAVQVFLAFTLMAGFLAHHPYIPVGFLAQLLPVLLVQSLPLSICFATLVGAVLATEALRRRQGLLWIEMAGGFPLRPWIPALGVGLVLTAALLWLTADVLPVANYRLRYLSPTAIESPTTLALRLAEAPTSLGRLRAHVRAVEDGEMVDLALASPSGSGGTVLAARRGRAQVAPGGQHLTVRLADGRLLDLDEQGALVRNLRFEALNLRFDVRRIAQRSKRSLISLKHYTNEELERVPGQYRELLRKGWPVSERARRRAAATGTVRALRVQLSLLPLLLLLLAVTFLGRHVPTRRGLVVIGVLTAGLLLLMQHSLLDVRAYKHGHAFATGFVFLPTFEVLALCGLRVIVPPLRRIAARAR